MKHFFLLICSILTSAAQANQIELDIQSKNHAFLEFLFHSDTHQHMPIAALGIQEGETREYQGTCLTYSGYPNEESITIRLLKRAHCLSAGELFEEEESYCLPATITVTVDGFENNKYNSSIKIIAHRGKKYIIHEKYPQLPLTESVYCHYPL